MHFESYDRRIKYYPLHMQRPLDNLPNYGLPAGYRFSFYDDGDRDNWTDIELSAGECLSREEGLKYWNEYFEPRKDELAHRMVFVEDGECGKVATATMLYDVAAGDDGREAWLHWVAVRQEYQGKGLSKPLISHVLRLMRESGYTRCKLSTHTWANLACRIYLDMGFRPCRESLIDNLDGWRIIRTITEHPDLASIVPFHEKDIPLSLDIQ